MSSDSRYAVTFPWDAGEEVIVFRLPGPVGSP
jgi:hypothetical protein